LEAGGITYAAHVEEENGILYKGSYTNLWTDPKIVMAAQINKADRSKNCNGCAN